MALYFVRDCAQLHSLHMLSRNLIETEALKVRCPTCGAAPHKRCELAIGGIRPQSHLERRLIASDKVVKMTRAGVVTSHP